jgi:hypothetical protein
MTTTLHEVRNGIVYKKDTFDDGTWQEVALGASSVVEIIGERAATINTDLPLQVIVKDWEGNPVSFNGTATITEKSQGMDASVSVEVYDGVGEFAFNSDVAGVFRLEAHIKGIIHNSVPLEVTVVE